MEQQFIDQIRGYIPIFAENPYLQALAVILLALIVAKVTDLIVERGILRLAGKTRSEILEQIVRLLHRPIFLTVLLIGLIIALEILPLTGRMEEWGTKILYALIALIWLSFGIRTATRILDWMKNQPERFTIVQPSTQPLFEVVVKILIIGLGIYYVFVSLGVPITPWLASAGLLGLAVGLAAQDTLGNLFAGISILADAPYKIGDYIILEGTDRGRVTKIGLRSTRILTRDDIEITVPNSLVGRSRIINLTGGPSPVHRLKIPIGVAYGSDVEQVRKILLDVTHNCERLSDRNEPWVQFNGFGDSSLNFQIRCWTDDPAHGRIFDEINTAAYRELSAAGIEIPFPKRDVYIKEIPKAMRREIEEG